MGRLRSPLVLAAAGLALLLVVVVALLAVFPSSDTYIVLPHRAEPVGPLVTVQGARAHRYAGGIYFVDVIVRKATILERAFPSLRDGATLVPATLENPTGESEHERRQQGEAEMQRSHAIAAAVALRSLGYPVRVRATGALVEAVQSGRPAAEKLEPGDVIVSVNGVPVRTPQELRRVMSTRRPGQSVEFEVRRRGKTVTARVPTVADPRDARRAIVGILVDQATSIRLPRRVEIDTGNVIGPSAGLAFALDVLEELGRDVDHGRRIAVTGALDVDGQVLPVGGVKQKTIGVRRSGLKIFVVPAGDNAAEARANADGVRIVPVASFQQALQKLATITRSR